MNEKEKDIIEAALILFAERGYDGTTVPLIAERAHVGAGTIYRYFENKESLLNVIFSRYVQLLSKTLQTDFPESASTRAQFRHLFYQLVRFSETDLSALMMIVSHANVRHLNDSCVADYEAFLDFVRAIVENGVAKEVIRPLPTNAVISIVYGAFIHLAQSIQHGEIESSPRLLQEVEESLWRAVSL
ncbi:TetR/AcrR family transcriptional regulator [Shouchella lonarensis]|uniref:Transcriptional regulator, TetR family n=1 Tax=Shouchella lonarensis TaxID=1464122 RepID=A0A1G6HKX8_9BACI|nr:TetR/AcrR family transcriptional regulator [Shouchella lonarensis]SDB94892.1 transcriptional regulator, TetR family [Shouchella lonarensis]